MYHICIKGFCYQGMKVVASESVWNPWAQYINSWLMTVQTDMTPPIFLPFHRSHKNQSTKQGLKLWRGWSEHPHPTRCCASLFTTSHPKKFQPRPLQELFLLTPITMDNPAYCMPGGQEGGCPVLGEGNEALASHTLQHNSIHQGSRHRKNIGVH